MTKFDNIRIAQLIARSVAEELAPDQRRELDEWLSASPSHRELMQRITSGESLSTRQRLLAGLDIADGLKGIEVKIRRGRRMRRLRRSASAAAVLIAAAAGIYFFAELRNSVEPAAPQTHQAILSFCDGSRVVLTDDHAEDEWKRYVRPQAVSVSDTVGDPAQAINMIRVEVQRGKEYRLMLPDSSMVWLNSESTIEYPATFAGDSREVSVTGEVFFDVERDPERPFRISAADDLSVTVLGTRFNVNSYPDGEQVQVSLVEGRVSVAGESGRVTLEPNQQAVYNRGDRTLKVRDVPDASVYSAWTDGLFDFEGEPLDVILGTMAKWYDIRFVYNGVDPDQLGHFTVHTQRGGDFNTVSEILKKITGLRYDRQGDTVYVSYQ